MRSAFTYFKFLFHDAQIAKVAERPLQQCARVEILKLLWSARAVFQLLRCIAHHDQEAAGFERAAHACPFDRTLGGPTELSEYFGNHVEHPLRIGPRMHVGLDDREPDLT